MRAVIASLAGCLSGAVPAALLADDLCYKPRFGNNPVSSETRACRLNGVVDDWLTSRGIGSEWWLQTHERVGAIGNSFVLFDVRAIKPSAVIEVFFTLGQDQSIAATEAIRLRPGYFSGLEALLLADGKAVICETMGPDETAFVASGGEVTYNLGLKPSVFDHRTPDWYAQISFPQSSCEAN
jgi:hypothetical protein